MTESVEQLLIPRLAVGAYPAHSGVGCVMNLMCWVNGEEITDNPTGWLNGLRHMLIELNDSMCYERTLGLTNAGEPVDLNCPQCSQFLIDAAFALSDSGWAYPVYTGMPGLITEDEYRVLRRRIAQVSVTTKALQRLVARRWYAEGPGQLTKQDRPTGQQLLDEIKADMRAVIDYYTELRDKYNPPRQSLPPFVHTVADAVTTGQFMATAPALVTVPEGSSIA